MIYLQEKRLAQEIADIEKDTGFKLRVLAQNYPETPGTMFCILAFKIHPNLYLGNHNVLDQYLQD